MPRPKRTPYDPALAEYQRNLKASEDAKKRDRRSTDLLRNAQVAPIEIDDPLGDGKLIVMRSTRDDPLANLHARYWIDEAQYRGGRAFQYDFEMIQSRPQAVDASQPYVDRSFRHRRNSDAYSKAFDRLNRAHAGLGQNGSALATDVLIHGMTIEQIAMKRATPGQIEIRYLGKRFRECLDSLALTYGFAMEKR